MPQPKQTPFLPLYLATPSGALAYDLPVCWISTFRFQARGSAAEQCTRTVYRVPSLLSSVSSLRAKHTRKADRIASTLLVSTPASEQ
jgi:hypothetical protein